MSLAIFDGRRSPATGRWQIGREQTVHATEGYQDNEAANVRDPQMDQLYVDDRDGLMNGRKRWRTAANDGKRQRMTTDEQATAANDGERRPAMPNNSEWQRTATKGSERRPMNRQ